MLGKPGKLGTVAWLIFWGGLSTTWCWTAAQAIGPTFDEPFYIQGGLKNWHDLSHRELLTQGTMPLPTEVQTLPLAVAEFFGAEPQADLSIWLPIARRTNVVFWWLLLWASYRLTVIYGGTTAGCLAVALVACEPVLLGHASLATTDVAFSACLLALMAVFRARREMVTWQQRLLWPAVWCMLTVLAKASALLFVPLCLTAIELERLWIGGWRPSFSMAARRPLLRSLRDLALIGLLGFALVLIVCPRASRGLLFQIRHNLDGHGGSFLLGETHPIGYWYYFPATLAIKLGVPLFILQAVLLAARPRYFLNGATLAALVALAATPTFRVQVGVRLVLPIAVLAIVGAAAAFARLWSEQEIRWRRILCGGFMATLVVWSVSNASLVWPHGICYTNELFGRTAQGYLALNDSNFDWGQGLNELAAWQRKHPEAPLIVRYFGTDPSLPRLPMQAIATLDLLSPAETYRGNYLAVSTNYCGIRALAEKLGTPCARTMTYLIYDFRVGSSAIE